MLKISLIVVGEKMPKWVAEGYQEYAKRIRGRVNLELIEIAAGKRGKNADLNRIIAAEENRILRAIPDKATVIALDRNGKSWSTNELANNMQIWIDGGDQIAMIVGGPEGLSSTFLNNVAFSWSLSALTFAHPLVRVILAEQLYRSYSILEGAPYHR